MSVQPNYGPSEAEKQATVPPPDPAQIRRFAELLFDNIDGCIEARVFQGEGKNQIRYVGYFDSPGEICKAVLPFHAKAQIYFGLTPRQKRCFQRSPNRLTRGAAGGKTEDIVSRCWFPIDLDTEKPKFVNPETGKEETVKVSATGEELEKAVLLNSLILPDLQERGIQPILGMSGNGTHLLIHTLPYPSERLWGRKQDDPFSLLLNYFNRIYRLPGVDVDTSTFDPPRIWKVYGTAAIKGPNTIERPWRTATFEPPTSLPDPVDILQIYEAEIYEQWEIERSPNVVQLKDKLRSNSTLIDATWAEKYKGDLKTLDIVGLFQSEGLYRSEIEEFKHSVTCPWQHEHTTESDKETVVWEAKDDAWPTFHCSHNHCKDRKLAAVLDYFGTKTVDAHCSAQFKRTTINEKTPASELAVWFLDDSGFQADGSLKLRYYREEFYCWSCLKYERLPTPDLKASIVRWLQDQETLRNVAGSRLSNEILTNLQGMCLVPFSVLPPAMLDDETAPGKVLIPMGNGLFDLDQRIVHAHTSHYFNLSAIPYDYDPKAVCPTWLRFITETHPDQEVRDLVQEWFGYNLIVDSRQEKFALFEGSGANGKSVCCTVLKELLGAENVSAVPLEAFSPTRTFPLAQTYGKLANIVEEMGEIEKAAEGVLKQYVTGGVFTIERKYKDPFEINPTARLTFATNVLPRFVDRSNGLWRRMLLIPFRNCVTDESKQQKEWGRAEFWRSNGELPGIFNWALEGLDRLNQRGYFVEPALCKAEKAKYRLESNPARVFLEENCLYDAQATLTSAQLHSQYFAWAKESGYKPLSAHQFAKEVVATFPYVRASQHAVRTVGGTRSKQWIGIRLRTQMDDDEKDDFHKSGNSA